MPNPGPTCYRTEQKSCFFLLWRTSNHTIITSHLKGWSDTASEYNLLPTFIMILQVTRSVCTEAEEVELVDVCAVAYKLEQVLVTSNIK